MNSLEGKVAMITGAGSKRGMGHAIAVRLAREGADIVIIDKEIAPKSIWPGDENWGGLNDVAAEIKAEGREALVVVADISSSKDVDEAVARALEKFGKIDILVQCVGIRGPMATPIAELDEKVWRRILDVNLNGPFLITRAVAKTMIPDGEGKKIVLISSLAGSRGYAGSAAYCASKHGVIGLAKTLALELAQYKINVNIISPGAFDTNLRDESIIARAEAEGISVAELLKRQSESKTPQPGPQIPLGRMGKPEDIADLVLFLVSDLSSYITGEEIQITGGAD
jgi:NAD(P)-dependent dehydrogenase (short-subunit alcohol dehydrogenase family)